MCVRRSELKVLALGHPLGLQRLLITLRNGLSAGNSMFGDDEVESGWQLMQKELVDRMMCILRVFFEQAQLPKY